MAYPEVVRVFATTQDPDHDSPWQTRSPSSSTGSGVVIAGGAIREETLVRARRDGPIERVVARYADYDCGATPLPRRVEIEAPASGWSARVTILEQALDVTLDDALFVVPDARRSHAGG